MENQKEHLVDITRLYTLRRYSETFGISYNTLYNNYLRNLTGRSKMVLNTIKVSGVDMIYVSKEDEELLLEQNRLKKKIENRIKGGK